MAERKNKIRLIGRKPENRQGKPARVNFTLLYFFSAYVQSTWLLNQFVFVFLKLPLTSFLALHTFFMTTTSWSPYLLQGLPTIPSW